ncbi:MarR family winged helix-turn-helix transcriptional regulator [Sphingobium sufflavum]|uniref:MarR family winged helix-turn-helix transcriptional regulator n=1 Tax=Sphingobium sufflavum TaxID=1129547 RepID=UPI001F259F94|nr:MarR family winged helix-turn-helix transcriptional regulator [Sphingobium sufflavum]MCE7796688.1 MarR family winged helix-turn-helix transcriptional regulator [Sphingobium sufflavum]
MKKQMSNPTQLVINEAEGIGVLDGLASVQLRRVDTLLLRGFAHVSKAMHLRPGMISCLGLIVAHPGISQKDIAARTGRDKSIIVSLIDSLEERGWATRTRSKVDHRRYELRPTAEGERRLEELARDIRELEGGMLAGVTPQDLEQLFHLLQKMHHSCVSFLKNQPKS